jgi:hypothetical protein
MRRVKWLCVALVFCLVPAVAQPPMFGPDDTKLVLDYELTLDKVGALGDTYAEMNRACDAALNQKRTAIVRQTAVSQTIANVAADPQLMAYFSRHGLTADDAVLKPLVLIGVALALSPSDAAKYNMPVSPAQMAVYHAHPILVGAVGWDPVPCKN